MAGYLVVDVLDASLAGANVPAVQAQVAHARQGQLPQVALLHPAAHQGHGNVTLHPHSCTSVSHHITTSAGFLLP